MTYKTELNVPSRIVHVIYIGTASLAEREQAVDEVCNKYNHVSPLTIMVDVRELVMDLSFEEQMTFGKYLASHPGLTDARVAVLHNPGFNPNVVIDANAYSNGYTLAQFSSYTDAELWLLKQI